MISMRVAFSFKYGILIQYIEVKKDDKIHIASCPFCASEDFDLCDVDPNEKVA